MWAALDLGGTVTGEHGIGTLKARHLARQLGPDVMELTRAGEGRPRPHGHPQPRQVGLT